MATQGDVNEVIMWLWYSVVYDVQIQAGWVFGVGIHEFWNLDFKSNLNSKVKVNQPPKQQGS